ncbi:MAG: PadR family transcriptional regulator [Propionibacteriaceae bacterium]|nr:PadR family transcriptional regulator [Propionibacteriaceae bacterium]
MTPDFNEMNPNPRRGRGRGRRHEGRMGPRRGGVHGRGGPHGRRRAQRGDVRAAILTLLAEEPMHGYQLMQTIAQRSEGRWTPSPGAIYPTLSALSDEGLVTMTEAEGRKLASLTPAGTDHVEQHRASWSEPFQREAATEGPNLHGLTRDLAEAVRHAARTASPSQRERLATILTTARRDVYRALLSDDGSEPNNADGEPVA